MSTRSAIEALIEQARDEHQNGRYPRARELAVRARRQARDADLRDLELVAWVQMACSQSAGNPPSSRLMPFEPILALVDEEALGELEQDEQVGAALVQAYVEWASSACYLSWVDCDEILEMLDQGMAFVDEHDRPPWRADLCLVRARALREHGRVPEAIPYAEEAFALAPSIGSCSLLAEMFQDQGREKDAWRHYVWLLDNGHQGYSGHFHIGILLSLQELASTPKRRKQLHRLATEQVRRMGYEDPEDPSVPPILRSLMGREP